VKATGWAREWGAAACCLAWGVTALEGAAVSVVGLLAGMGSESKTGCGCCGIGRRAAASGPSLRTAALNSSISLLMGLQGMRVKAGWLRDLWCGIAATL